MNNILRKLISDKVIEKYINWVMRDAKNEKSCDPGPGPFGIPAELINNADNYC